MEIEPLCVLDFYVHESCQRQGLGIRLFEAVLTAEGADPACMGYDRPSRKLMAFLAKHFGLTKYTPQVRPCEEKSERSGRCGKRYRRGQEQCLWMTLEFAMPQAALGVVGLTHTFSQHVSFLRTLPCLTTLNTNNHDLSHDRQTTLLFSTTSSHTPATELNASRSVPAFARDSRALLAPFAFPRLDIFFVMLTPDPVLQHTHTHTRTLSSN